MTLSLPLIYAFVFTAVLLLVDAIARNLTGKRRANRDVNERLRRLSAGGDQTATYKKLLDDRGASGDLLDRNIFSWFARLYRQSGLNLSLQQRLLYSSIAVLGSVIACGFLVSNLAFQILGGIALGFLLLIALVSRLRSRRLKRFVEQLPLAIDIIVRSLNAGHPLLAAIALVGREMPDPIGSEFGILSDQLTFGLELDQAMLGMVERVGAEELNLLAVTVSVQRGTGGNLSEILENLAQMIRDRSMLRAKIRAISAEGRMTAKVMAAFPFGLYFIISALAPSYFDPVWESGYGTVAVGSILAIMTLGIIVMNRIVRFDF